MLSPDRVFHASTILSTLHDRLLDAEQGVGGMGTLLSYMCGDDAPEPQLGRLRAECVTALAEQHPDLATLKLPEITTFADFQVWLGATMLQTGGELMRSVTPLDEADHTSMSLEAELAMRGMGDKLLEPFDLGE